MVSHTFDWQVLPEIGDKSLGIWLIDRDLKIVHASQVVCEALGFVRSELIGQHILQLDLLTSLSASARAARLEHIFDTGRPDTLLFWQQIPDRGWTRLMATSSRVSDNLILNVAHDITAVDDSQLWVRSEIFSLLPVLIADADGVCRAATEGIARLCGYSCGRALVGQSIVNTPFASQAEQEHRMVEKSRVLGKPVHTVEWTVDDSGLHQYVLTRIALEAGHWMIIMQEITGSSPHVTQPPTELISAANLQPRLSRKQFQVLRGWWHGEPRESTASRLHIKAATVDYHRDKLKGVFGAEHPNEVIQKLRGSLLSQVLDLYPLSDS